MFGAWPWWVQHASQIWSLQHGFTTFAFWMPGLQFWTTLLHYSHTNLELLTERRKLLRFLCLKMWAVQLTPLLLALMAAVKQVHVLRASVLTLRRSPTNPRLKTINILLRAMASMQHKTVSFFSKLGQSFAPALVENCYQVELEQQRMKWDLSRETFPGLLGLLLRACARIKRYGKYVISIYR